MTEDPMFFAEEQGSPAHEPSHTRWRILIIDDERDVHEATMLAVGRERICGRPVEFLHAYTALQASEILRKHDDIAVILLDVVMEHEAAGLELVRTIREDLNIQSSRIVLRTGQPGYAPELEAITRYEINDYKAKSELTRNKLVTSLTTAVRSYAQIRALEISKKGLETIIRASRELIYLHGYQEFANGLIIQLTGLLGVHEEGLVCAKRSDFKDSPSCDNFRVIAAAGRCQTLIDQTLEQINDTKLTQAITETAKNKKFTFNTEYTCLYFEAPDESELVVYLSSGVEVAPELIPLLEMFSTNIAACMDNVALLERQHIFAYHDSLCDLPNRLSFLQTIDEFLTRKTPGLVAVLVDIDHFSQLNDTLGTETGDEIIRAVGQRLKEQLGHHPCLARIAGDSFGLLGLGTNLSPGLVREVFEHPFCIGDHSHTLSITQGRAALLGQRASTDVLAQASMALKRAKLTLRGGSQEFHSDLLKETENRVQLLQNLRRSFTEERLYMVYQPKIDLKTGELCGFEALMRWKREDGEFVPPLEFIPIAESSGLIVALGEWALRTALIEAVRLTEHLGRRLAMAVNVSVVQFAHPGFRQMLSAALEESNAPTDLLELEVTESVAMQDIAKVRIQLEALRELGIRISIDDFGTGFSSLTYLENLPVNALKIDKSFIDRLRETPPEDRIPETILHLGHVLKLDVIAEGVETEDQVHWLRGRNCHQAQGYFFSPPLTRDQLYEWLSTYQPSALFKPATGEP